MRELQQAEMKIYADRQKVVVNNLTVLWGIVIGQCTPMLQEELRAEEDYDIKSSEYDSIWLLKTLQRVTAGINKTTNVYYSLLHALEEFYTIKQRENESVED